MIPRIIHYCWFGREPMPELALRCIESWHRYMPNYEYMLWDENRFNVESYTYTKEAYESGKFAFVSDVVRLEALARFGGIYLDVDFEVYKSFDVLLSYKAFAGFEGSKHNPVMMGVIASEQGGEWVMEQLATYQHRHFIVGGKMDLITNVKYISDNMQRMGFIPDGREQDYKDLHIFPVEFFSPRLTTGEYKRTENTFCEHKGKDSSWASKGIKSRILNRINPRLRTFLIKFKRKILG